MANEALVRAVSVCKSYPLYDGLGSRLRAIFAPGTSRERHQALSGVSFELGAGESVGIMGFNGSGKSTLLRLLAGIAKPSSGELSVNGRVTAVFGLGTSFDAELTGRENARREAALYGMDDEAFASVESSVAEFAEIGAAMDRPIRSYSSGMRARLGLAIVLHLPFEILLLDEVLAVGDDYFREKAYEALDGLRRRGQLLIMVTHSPYDVLRLCTRALWLDRGRLLKNGDPREVALDYLREAYFDTYGPQAKTLAGVAQEGPRHELLTAEHIYGSGEVRVVGLTVTALDGGPPRAGAPARLSVRYAAKELVRGVACYVGFMNARIIRVFAAVSLADQVAFDIAPGEGSIEAAVEALPVAPGEYIANVGLYRADDGPDALRYYDHDSLLFRKGTPVRVEAADGASTPDAVLQVPHVWR